MKPHKHADLIKAWADGAKIEFKNHVDLSWSYIDKPAWHEDFEYRIKPETPPFEMIPHWPGIIQVEESFFLTEMLLTKEDLLENEGFLRLALELPPIMLPRRIK